MAKRGYLRSVEALIAIVMLMASFQAFMNWGSLKAQPTQSIKQSAYDIFFAREGANALALYDTQLYDEFVSTMVPSNMNYRLEADYFSPLDTFFGYNDTDYPHEVTIDLPAGSGMVSVASPDGTQAAHQAVFDWYRAPFFIRSREAGFTNQRVVLGLTLPYADSNGDGVLEAPDKNSVDIYLNGTRQSFTMHDFSDTGVLSKITVSFRRYTLEPNAIVEGYAYYMVGSQTGRLIPVAGPVTGSEITVADVGRLGAATQVPSLALYNGQLYGGTDDSGKVYRYDGGTTWTDASGQLGANTLVHSLAVYNGGLYAGTAPSGKVYRYDGTAWTDVGRPGVATQILSLAVYSGKLYAGTDDSGKVYGYDGTTWTFAGRPGAATQVLSLALYNGQLYGGTDDSGKVYQYDDGTKTWTYTGGPLGTPRVLSLAEHNDGKLYAGTAGSARAYRYDGTNWIDVGQLGLGTNTHVYSLALYGGELYGGTNPSGKVYRYDGPIWTDISGQLGANTLVHSLVVYGKKLYAGTAGSGRVYSIDNGLSTFYETGQKPAEKTSRAQVVVRLPSTSEPATYLMNYALSGPEAVSAVSDLSYFEDSSSFVASNSILSVAVDKSTGKYSLKVGPKTMFTAQPHLEESGITHSTGPANPLVVASGLQKLSINWSMTDTKVRIDHLLTLYSNRPEILVQQRVVAREPGGISVDDLELDRLSADSSLTSVYAIRSTTGEYDNPWETASFSRYEPWVSFYNPAEAVGIVFDSPDFIRTTPGKEVMPQESPGHLPQYSVITRNAHIIYSNSKYSARDLWLKKKGLAEYDHQVDWHSTSTFVETAPSSFQFNLVKSQKYATLASLSFNVTYTDYSDETGSMNLTCYLNGNLVINRQPYNNTVFRAEVPYRWLSSSGANTVSCRTFLSNSVGIARLNVTVANMYGAGKFFWGLQEDEGGWMMPITLTGLSQASYSAVVSLDYLKLGLGGPFNRSSFRLVNEGGYQIPLNVSDRRLYFSVDVPACCQVSRTVYLLFSKASDFFSFFSEGWSTPVLPVARLNDFGSDFGIIIDAGIARPVNPKVLYTKPPSKASYAMKEMPPAVKTETAKKFVFDPAGGRAAVIKLMVWRKA